MPEYKYYTVCNKLALSGGKMVGSLPPIWTLMLLSTGGTHSLLSDSTNQVWTWALNSVGQLGNNSTTNQCTPVSIHGAKKTFCMVNASGAFSLGIDRLGQVWSWGAGFYGQLGNNSTANRCTPHSIQGAKKTFCMISGGGSHSIGIDHLGQVWSWGYNLYGQLGDNSTTSRRTPVSIQGAKKTFCMVSGGSAQSLGVDYQGQVWCWGLNTDGQLGDNSTTARCTPHSIQGVKKTFCHISGGISHSLGIDRLGQVWSWGNNVAGRLGDNSTTNRCTPVSIHGAKKTFCMISGGEFHSLGVDRLGQVWGWGWNYYGQLGDNSTASKRIPASIRGAKKTFCHISGGNRHSLGIDHLGQVWGWGRNADGQLGDNSTTNRCTPVRVCNF